jgi:hypothetical protein
VREIKDSKSYPLRNLVMLLDVSRISLIGLRRKVRHSWSMSHLLGCNVSHVILMIDMDGAGRVLHSLWHHIRISRHKPGSWKATHRSQTGKGSSQTCYTLGRPRIAVTLGLPFDLAFGEVVVADSTVEKDGRAEEGAASASQECFYFDPQVLDVVDPFEVELKS